MPITVKEAKAIGKPDTNTISAAVGADGWVKHPVGYYRSNGQTKENTDFALYTKRSKIASFFKKDAKDASQKSRNGGLLRQVSNTAMGGPSSCLTPATSAPSGTPAGPAPAPSGAFGAVAMLSGQTVRSGRSVVVHTSPNLPMLSDFSKYPSLRAVRRYGESLVIAFDSEWVDVINSGRRMLSWQFACVDGDDLCQFVFLAMGDKRLTLELALGRILDDLDYPSYPMNMLERYDVVRQIESDMYCAGSSYDYYSETFDNYRDATMASITNGVGYVGPDEDGNAVFDPLIYIPDREDRFKKRNERNYAYFRKRYDTSDPDLKRIPVTLLCHAGSADLSSFDRRPPKHRDVMKYCSDVAGGLITMIAVTYVPKSVDKGTAGAGHPRGYWVTLDVRDTMCHAPADSKSLENLGKVVGVPKVSLPETPVRYIERMHDLLTDDPRLFFRYAANDAVVTLFYAAGIYGFNKGLAVTITSATARVMHDMIAGALGCKPSDTAEFDRVYRGLVKDKRGMSMNADTRRLKENYTMIPVNRAAGLVQEMARAAYFGGLNTTSDIGYFPEVMFDYDLQNAYPTSMCLCRDVDWNDPVLPNGYVRNRYLDLSEWHLIGNRYDPVRLFVGYVSFEFPNDVKYCSIPIRYDDVPVFPKTSNGYEGVYASGPDVYLALCLGAKVYCHEGYFLRTLIQEDGGESASLAVTVKQFVTDRAAAVTDTGDKHSLIPQILKLMVNSGYGKIAQNVIDKQSWSAYSGEMSSIGMSSVTNPVLAMMITSIVRCVLIAAQEQLTRLGYVCCSVTTDGFITNASKDVLDDLDLFGFSDMMRSARVFLFGSPELWEIKHAMDDLVNYTSRGNVSLYNVDHTDPGQHRPFVVNGTEYAGVCAHNSTKSPFISDSLEDREWLYERVISRTGPVEYFNREWTSFRDMMEKERDHAVHKVHVSKSMDFDLKRKPVRSSSIPVMVPFDGNMYEVCGFTTVPFENVNEFRLYRDVYKSSISKADRCLRTKDDLDWYFMRVDLKLKGNTAPKISGGPEWSRLRTCVKGHYAGAWNIPKLDQLDSMLEIVAWLNTHNHSVTKKVTVNDLKNWKRPGRREVRMDQSLVQALLDELIEDI